MACDCIHAIEARPDLADHRIDVAICLTRSGLVARTYSALIRRDNGKRESRRNKLASIIATFCPFCGVRYEPAPAIAADQEQSNLAAPGGEDAAGRSTPLSPAALSPDTGAC
jgi:hypothetical protein